MATGKRYYWIKLKESFMTSDTVDYLMGLPNGANYVVLYQMLILKTINTDGRLSRQIGEVIIPYNAEKIQRDCKWFSIDTVRVALNAFIQLGLVYQDNDGVLVMADHENLVGSETNWAAQKRAQGRNNPPLPAPPQGPPNPPDDPPSEGGNGVESGVENFHPENRGKSLEGRGKRTENRGVDKEGKTVGTPGDSPVVLTLPLNDGSEYPVTQSYVDEMAKLYPAVDIMQELRKMRGWCDANPTRRKTQRGIKAFINRWLSDDQDNGGKFRHQRPAPPPQPQQSGVDRIAQMMKGGKFDES